MTAPLNPTVEAFRIACDMEDDVEDSRVFANGISILAAEALDDDQQLGAVFMRLAWRIAAHCKDLEERRRELFKLLHPSRDQFEREGWPGEKGPREPAGDAVTQPEIAELRSRAEALAAEYTAPLPSGRGDAGLLEAARRLRDIGTRDQALYRDPAVTEAATLQEEDLLEAVLAPARNFLLDYIEKTAPTTLAGAAVKLRRACDQDFGVPNPDLDDNESSLYQVVEFIEREARS